MRKILKLGDEINFRVGDETYKFLVQETSYGEYLFLYTPGQTPNSIVFDKLGMDKDKWRNFAKEIFGYPSVLNTVVPVAKKDDFEAITRLVNALIDKCNEFNSKL